MLAEGVAPDRRANKIHAVGTDRPTHIVKNAAENHLGSIVEDRRGVVGFIDAYLIGRVSDRVLKRADQLDVWII